MQRKGTKDAATRADFFAILVPSVTVFVSSACIMVLELVAGRLVARYLGSSLYTWTSVIGVVLTGITLGNYLGGRIADRYPPRRVLAVLFAAASVACVAVVVLDNLAGWWGWMWQFSWPVRVFCHVAIVFLLPSALLGTISPVVAKMALDSGLPTGRTVGDIYAWGAAGSIVGTFLAGFYLIAMIGTITIIWAIGAVLLLTAILYRPRFWPLYAWGAVFVAVMTMGMSRAEWAQVAGEELALRPRADRQVIYEDETQYCLVQVKKISEEPDTRTFVQDRLIHSRMVMDDIGDLQYYYTQLYAVLTKALSQGKDKLSTLSIGGGGYVFPRYVESTWPGSRVDVVEIDPGVTEAAIQAFGLARDSSVNTFTMDARNYVDDLIRQNGKGPETVKYDFIYEDALNDYSIPFQLVTRQFNDKIADILADDGIYLIELIDTYESGRFLAAVVNTLRETFSCVRVVTDYARLPAARRTFIILAAKYDIDLEPVLAENTQTEKLWLLNDSELQLLIDKTDGIILTDTYAPVENLLAPVVRADATAERAQKYMKRAGKLKEQRRWRASIAEYRKAAQVTPLMRVEAYNEIGVICITLGDFAAAARYLQEAVEFNERQGSRKPIPVSYLNLALVLKRLNNPSQAAGHLQKAIQGFREELAQNPDSVETLLQLGNALAESGEFTEAGKILEQAVALDPGRAESYHYLATLLKLQRKYDEAAAQLHKGIKHMSEKGRIRAAAELRKALESLEKDRNE